MTLPVHMIGLGVVKNLDALGVGEGGARNGRWGGIFFASVRPFEFSQSSSCPAKSIGNRYTPLLKYHEYIFRRW